MKKALDWFVYLAALAMALPLLGLNVTGLLVALIITFLLAPR